MPDPDRDPVDLDRGAPPSPRTGTGGRLSEEDDRPGPPRPEGAVDESALTAAMDEFATTLAGAFSAEQVLSRLAEAAVAVLDVDGAGTMVATDGDLLRFTYASGPRREPVTDLELVQERTQAGPCHDSVVSGEVIDIADLAVEGNWTDYQRRAVAIGLNAITTVPLTARGRSWGVLDLYRTARRQLVPRELEVARTLANLATSCLVVTADRTAAQDAAAQLAHRAMHDPLTGLPVRWVLLEQLGHAAARLERHPGMLGVLFLDLDGLKYVNDTYGHATGDTLLVTCARRVRAGLRPADLLARVGGDEFVVVLEDLTDAATATDVARRVLTQMTAPHQVDGHRLQPSASIGVAVTSDPAHTAEGLIAHADAAMYEAKRAGRGRVALFDATRYEAHRAEATGTTDLLPALRAAVVRGELTLHYQPVVALHRTGDPVRPATRRWHPDDNGSAGAVHAVEALLRWDRPGHGTVPAADFIDLAERSGLLVDLSAWTLRTACAQLVTWDATLGESSPPRVFVNISAVELLHPRLPDAVATALGRTGIDAARLTLEITETGLLSDPDAAAASVQALLALGCELAIDDFGVGYSTLSRLVHLPARTLKIDRSFTADLTTSPAARAVATAVLQLGAALDRVVIVEGVQDASTLHALRDLGATHVQGYHLATPQPPEQLTATMLRAHSAQPERPPAMDPERSRAALATGFALSGLTSHQLLLRCTALSDAITPDTLTDLLDHAQPRSHHQHDVVTVALNEHLADHGMDHPVPTSDDLTAPGRLHE